MDQEYCLFFGGNDLRRGISNTNSMREVSGDEEVGDKLDRMRGEGEPVCG